jgi:hypothetical protein
LTSKGKVTRESAIDEVGAFRPAVRPRGSAGAKSSMIGSSFFRRDITAEMLCAMGYLLGA